MKTRSEEKPALKINRTNGHQIEPLDSNILSKKEETALKVIHKHSGKRFVYETYRKACPEMALKYLRFICRNPGALYIKWDNVRKEFVA
jgi:hypothetical protein